MTKTMRWMMLAAVVAFLVSAPFTASAEIITLADDNSMARIDPRSQRGMYDWIIDGNDIMFQQWFWYRIGEEDQQSVNTISSPTVDQLAPDQVTITYANQVLSVELFFRLIGGAPGSLTSDVVEQVGITNNSDCALDFHFFQYSDFDLAFPEPDTLEVTGGNTAIQEGQGVGLSETIVGPTPDRWEVATYPLTLTSLNGVAYDLQYNLDTGPGDMTWAFQWDKNLSANGGTLLLSKDKHAQLVPEPTTLLILGTALFFLGRKFRVRRP